MFYESNGVLSNITEKGKVNFFKIREIHKERSMGSYLAIDCDIKDLSSKRIIKLAKNNPVVACEGLDITCNKNVTEVKGQEEELIIKVEQLDLTSDELIEFPPLKKMIENHPFGNELQKNLLDKKISAAIKITGHFYVDSAEIQIDDEQIIINKSSKLIDIFMSGANGIVLNSGGFSM